MLAIGEFLGSLPGTPTREPVFGLDAKWIAAELRNQAELSGATVVDRTSVITTHLAEIVNQHAARLLGREDVRLLTDVVKRTHPVVVEELTPTQLSLGEVQRVLQSLLDEGISIRDLVRIFEAISLRAAVTKDVDTLVESARVALGPAIVAQHTSGGTVHVISLDPRLEQQMLEAQRQTEAGTILALDARHRPAGADRRSTSSSVRPRTPTPTRSSSALRRSARRCGGSCGRRCRGSRSCPTPSSSAPARSARSA